MSVNDSAQRAARWKDLIARYLRNARERGSDYIEILREARELLGSVDAEVLRVLAEALADDETMWFVFAVYGGIVDTDRSEPGVRRLFLRGDPLPEELFEPMLRAALSISHLDGRSTRSYNFVQSLSVSFGYRRCAEFLITYCDDVDAADFYGVMNVLVGIGPNRWIQDPDYPPSVTGGIRVLMRDYEGEGLSEIRDNLRKALFRCYIRFDDGGIRSSISWITGFDPVKSSSDRDLLLEVAASMGIASADPRIIDILNPT